MFILKEAHRLAAKYLKKAEPDNAVYRLCRYVLRYYESESETCSLYNLVTGEAVALSRDESVLLEVLPTIYQPWMKELIERRYLVPAQFDEKDWVDCLRAITADITEADNSTPCYVITPTTACNAACWYCFENDVQCMTMDEQTADRVAWYISATCNGKPVSISWYGGEPTLRTDIIDRICTKLEDYGVKWQSLILTNAYILDKTAIRKAKTLWHLNRAIVPLDGDEITYNKTKAFTLSGEDVANPYYRVLDNIETLLQNDIFVQIRLNMGPNNADSLGRMIRETYRRFTKYDNHRLNVSLLSGKDERFGYYEDPTLADSRVELLNLADSLGFNIPNALPAMRVYGCMANRDNHVLINPKGGLSKCYAGIPEMTIGTIWEDNPEIPGATGTRLEIRQCDTCMLYPDCYRSTLCRNTCTEQMRNLRIKQMLHSLKVITEQQYGR